MAGVRLSWQKWRRKRQRNKLRDRRFDFLFETPQRTDVAVCFDCETTGLNPRKDKIITLSAVKIEGNQVLASQALTLLFRQKRPISPQSIVVHRIRNQDVLDQGEAAQEEREAMARFLEFIRGYPLVGYYLEFDVAMVNKVIKPWLGIELPNPQVEVSELYYRKRLQEVRHGLAQPNIDLKFDSILKRLEIPNLGQHDALNDALMTSLIFLKLQQPGK